MDWIRSVFQLDTLSFSMLSAAAMSHRQRCILTFHCTACTTLSHANEIMIKQLFYWFLHRRRRSMSKLRQFRTTWDDSGQFGTKCCAIIVASKMMVPVYPFTMNFCPLNGFHWMPNSPSCTECSVHPAESHWYPARRKPSPKSCHRMSPKFVRQMSQYVLLYKLVKKDESA